MKSILTAGENRRIAKAMLDYTMLADGDRVLVAVSGGIDSLVLAWVLHDWRRKAPINYEVQPVYVDMRPPGGEVGNRAEAISDRLAALGLSCHVLPAELPALPGAQQAEAGAETTGVCFQCARNRRRLLFDHAREQGFHTIALGHHRDDIVETFFINLTCSGNISTMRPKQVLFTGRLALIRPLAYLVKEEILGIGSRLGLDPVASDCPLSEKTRRKDIRGLLEQVYDQIPGSREHVFAALGNVRQDYLLLQDPSKHQKETHANYP
ncbi:MAG: PP-loop domain-containing protein [Candidatus Electrothrix sp. GM3_4]|nr:PP-loop domain-containing protein [Candidatus Electrothrix sp. GM3_4]